MTDLKVYSVTELNRSLKGLVEGAFREVRVEGEVSGLKVSSLGHTYFDLKDENSLIACVLFKGFSAGLKFRPANGMLVRARGGLTTYDKQSKYQLVARSLEPAGVGPLQEAFERLKAKLQKEGLFDQARKRPIPKLPQKIGIVTSPTGAAIKDMLSVLSRRYANLHIILAPVKVQGPGAKEEIAAAIEELNRFCPDADALLVGRGGGSMEDLWAFNEELVARAIAASRIPVISCVGHETDFTIADFVADLRAPTPSAAAELVVASKEELVRHIRQLNTRLGQSLRVFYENLRGRYLRLAGSRFLQKPELLTEERAQRLDEAVERASDALALKVRNLGEKAGHMAARLKTLDPEFPISKGYALARDAAGRLVTDAAALKEGDLLSVKLRKGEARTRVVKKD